MYCRVMLLLAAIMMIITCTVSAAQPTCKAYGTNELHFSKEGDVSIGGIFSFHQNPVGVNPALMTNPGNIRCNG